MDPWTFDDPIREFDEFVETQPALNPPGDSELPLENWLSEWYDIPEEPDEPLEEPEILPQGLFSKYLCFRFSVEFHRY